MNFIIHRGDTKDVGADESLTPAADGAVWRNAGVATQFPTLAAAQNKVVMHYHRPDGDYGDYDSSDYNDFWGLHLWTGAATETEWAAPLKPVRMDSFGPVFEVPLVADATAAELHHPPG